MKILITGGAGFIGSQLAEKLIDDGNLIVCVDNLMLGSLDNITELLKNDRFKFINSDVSICDELDKIFKQYKFDAVFHLAANSDIQKSAIEPSIDFKDTFLTTYSVLTAMKTNGVKKLFFSSTSAVYGENIGVKLSENNCDLNPISNYGGAKLASEAFIHSFSYMNDFDSLIFRFSNVIGPKLTHGVLFDFKKKLDKNRNELEIFGDGKQCKPYIHVSDLIEAILLLFSKNYKGVNIFNAGVDNAITVTEIAQILCDELGVKNVKFKYTGGDRGWKGDAPSFEYDLTKIHKAGWDAKYTSKQAVIEAARYLSNK